MLTSLISKISYGKITEGLLFRNVKKLYQKITRILRVSNLEEVKGGNSLAGYGSVTAEELVEIYGVKV